MIYALKGDSVDAKEFLKELNGTFNTGSCIFGALYSNRAMIVDAKNQNNDKGSDEPIKIRANIMNVDTVITLDQKRSRNLEKDIEYNMRGIRTYNLLKKIVWSCVLHKPSKDSEEKP